MPDADRVLVLLGQSASEPALEHLFRELNTLRRPELDPEDRNAFADFVLIRRQGLEFGFVDEVYFRAGPLLKRRRKGTPLIFHQVYFYTKLGDIFPFPDKLPLGLEWSDNRETVRQKLVQFDSTRRSYIKDAWTLPQFELVVEYMKENSGLFSVLCHLPLYPWPEEGRVQPALGVADWLALFGHPVTSTTLHDELRPLDIVKIIETCEDTHEVDFRFECGLQMMFTYAKNLKLTQRSALIQGKDLVLGAVRFLRCRELDARQWTGELPFQLSFDDSPVTMVERIGRPPDRRQDGRLTGFSLWSLTAYDLHIQYSTVENNLTQITIMAPGYWN